MEFQISEIRVHTGDDLDLGNTVAVTEDNTDLRGGGTLPVWTLVVYSKPIPDASRS